MDSDDAAPFDDPKIAINRVYTKKGDRGSTSLVGGQKVSKAEARIEAYGTVDELNAFVGAARQSALEASRRPGARAAELDALAASLLRVQHELFNLGAILATPPELVRAEQPRIRSAEVTRLETEIDALRAGLPALRSFVLPGASAIGAALHVCRTVCRRAERHCVTLAEEVSLDPEVLPYLNRLGDACFVWGRWADQVQGVAETLWDPNQAASVSDRKGENDEGGVR